MDYTRGVSRGVAIAALALLAGCARDNPRYGIADAGSGSSATSASGGGTSTTRGGGSAGGSSGDVDGTTGLDSSGTSGWSSSSAGSSSSSSGEVEPACPSEVGDDVVAHYRFEDPGDLWVDSVGGYNAELVSGGAQSVPGPRGCGDALGVGGEMAARVPDANVFDLPVGSIDFWVRATDMDDTVPILSRDAQGAATEHLTIFLSSVTDGGGDPSARHLVVRHQSEGTAAAVCSEDPLPGGEWVHVAYNFGPPRMELFIDGVLQESEAEPSVPGGGIPACDGRTNDPDLAGDPPPFVGGLQTALPWFIAASAQSQGKADQTPTAFMAGGALDEIRISAVRRDFELFR